MKPTPETTAETAGPLETSSAFARVDLVEDLEHRASLVRTVVPECIGLSLASIDHALSFTLAASVQVAATLDGFQYISGGPCLKAVEAGSVIEFQTEHSAAKDDWPLFTLGSAAAGVMSTLSLPVLLGDRPIGSVNIYATHAAAFTGHHHEVVEIFDAWAPGAITSAERSFHSRTDAHQVPQRLREDLDVQVALGWISTSESVDTSTAQALLVTAARRAAISQVELAAGIVALNRGLEGGKGPG